MPGRALRSKECSFAFAEGFACKYFRKVTRQLRIYADGAAVEGAGDKTIAVSDIEKNIAALCQI